MQDDVRSHLRNLAMQLVVQLHPLCHSKDEAHEVANLMHDLIDWQYQSAQRDRDFKVV